MAIICHCEAVKERAIVESIRRGASSVCEVADLCGAASRCGGCWDSVEELVARHAKPTPVRVAATLA
ncbi:MAG: (2Fe-2S)-binding protein [Ilumatobacteraceae bacterium]